MIYELGLEELVCDNQVCGRLSFSIDVVGVLVCVCIVYIVVGILEGEDGSVDMCYVIKVVEIIGDHVEILGVLVVIKSIVFIGVNVYVRKILEFCVLVLFYVVFNLEFLKEGVVIDDFMKLD